MTTANDKPAPAPPAGSAHAREDLRRGRMTDEPHNAYEESIKFYAMNQWLNVPVMLLLLPFGIAYAIVRAFMMRLFPARDLACDRWKVVCLTHVDWDHVWQRNHHTMSRLAESGHPVLYLMPVYLHVVLRWPAPILGPQVNRRPPGVTTWYPPMIPGGTRFPFIDRLNSWLIASEAIGRGFRKDLVLWFYYPQHESVRRALPHLAAVYDIQDEYSAFPWSSRTVKEAEARLLAECDVAFPGTHALYERKVPATRQSFFFACGVDVAHFEKAPETLILEPPPGGAKQGRPRLGYFGAIDKRIDSDLLTAMADRHPEWDIIMVGPVARTQFTIPARPNLYFTGGMPYTALPAFLHGWDIALMPWARNDLTEHINPTKTLEYLAARKPVVATSIPDLRKFYSDVLLLAESHDEFIAQCERALTDTAGNASRAEKGYALSTAASWKSVVAAMEGHVDDAIAARRGAARR